MAYSSPATVVTATTITSTWGNSVKAATDYLANPPACRVYHNTTQSINDVTETTVAFNSERFDTDSMHNTVTNNSRITFNTAGLYEVRFQFQLTSAADYVLIVGVIKANGAASNIATEDFYVGAAGQSARFAVATTYKFAVADYVEARVYQDNTANVARNVLSNAAYSPEFSAVWMGLG